MMKALSLALSLPLVACVVGSPGGPDMMQGGGGGGGGTGGGGGGTGSGSGSGSGSGVSGHITSDTTWMGTVAVSGAVTIDSGVTLTIAPGTTVDIGGAYGITVLGTLSAVGTSAGKITIEPASGVTHFGVSEGGVTVGDGTAAAVLTYAYVTQMGGGMLVDKAASATITDSWMSASPGDFLTTQQGSTLVMKYSQLGLDTTPTMDTTHCQTHFSGGTLTLVHSNIAASTLTQGSYGSMYYGADAPGNLKYDNWLSQATNATNVEPMNGAAGDFSNGYFMGGTVPTMAGITANNLSATRLLACDGTNDMTCAGPHP